ncbi:MAG: transmembrane anchor protein [Gemmatimonadetes bacterium]|nr:transmembrane anchor protein [Gemmatimonadota bacterium]
MYNVDMPPPSELPSSRALLRSTLIAAATAIVLLVTVVLPAEYGVDPTGVGRVLGLTEMGEIKMALAEEAAAAEAAETAAALAPAPAPAPPAEAVIAESSAPALRSDEASVTLAPGEGKEIKLAMREGASVDFQWLVDGGVVNSDTHADRPGLSYHGYMKGTAQASDEGVLVAAFDGMHGWFWRNRGASPVTVNLRTSGDYQELRHVN